MNLDELLNEFNMIIESYNDDPLVGSGDRRSEKDVLHRYNDSLTDLYRLLKPHAAKVYGLRTQHDDRACRAFKARVAKDINLNEGITSWSKCMDLATASDKYKEFLQEREFYYESWDSISHLRDTIKQYIINIGSRLSNN